MSFLDRERVLGLQSQSSQKSVRWSRGLMSAAIRFYIEDNLEWNITSLNFFVLLNSWRNYRLLLDLQSVSLVDPV